MRLRSFHHATLFEPDPYQHRNNGLGADLPAAVDHLSVMPSCLSLVSRELQLRVEHSISKLQCTGVTGRRERKAPDAAAAMVKLAGTLAQDESDWNAVAAKGNKAALSRNDAARDSAGLNSGADSRPWISCKHQYQSPRADLTYALYTSI